MNAPTSLLCSPGEQRRRAAGRALALALGRRLGGYRRWRRPIPQAGGHAVALPGRAAAAAGRQRRSCPCLRLGVGSRNPALRGDRSTATRLPIDRRRDVERGFRTGVACHRRDGPRRSVRDRNQSQLQRAVRRPGLDRWRTVERPDTDRVQSDLSGLGAGRGRLWSEASTRARVPSCVSGAEPISTSTP
jgi:hypothetical protein